MEASEQSNRISVPEISKIQTLETFLINFPKTGRIYFCDINYKNKNMKTISTNQSPLCILVGPEGDFSEKERQLIVDNEKTTPISLSKNILRAETAAIVASTFLSFHLNS